MSDPRDDRHGSSGRYRRTPEINAHGGSFVAGQGGRTVLPSLTAAFPTFPTSSHYQGHPYPASGSQHNAHAHSSRVSPGRSDTFSPSHGSHNWPHGNHLMPGQQPHYPYSPNEHDPRYSAPPSYSAYPTRHSPGLSNDPHASRRLPPLNIPQAPGHNDRWQTTTIPTNSYPHGSSMHPMPPASNARSPMASFPNSYDPYSYQHASSYLPAPDPRHLPPPLPSGYEGHSVPHGMASHNEWGMSSMITETHGISPYARSPPDMSSRDSPLASTPTDYPVIKKKRKRADAAQLKTLNEVYNRTAFPTTEERQELARKLDMSARSVQIWFQNKRQSMRQSRQSNALPPITHHPYTTAGPSDSPEAELPHHHSHSHGHAGSNHHGEVSVNSVAVGGSYMTRPSGNDSRPAGHISSHPSDVYRRGRSPEDPGDRRRRLGGPPPY